MQTAMKAVEDGICGVNQAATDHGIPKTLAMHFFYNFMTQTFL